MSDIDLTTRTGVKTYMLRSKSHSDWDERCDEVKRKNNGQYPDFWFEAIILSGVPDDIFGAGASRIKITKG